MISILAQAPDAGPVSLTPLIVIGCYLALLLGLAMFSGKLFRGTSKDYFVASHSIGPFMLLMSVFGTTMTAFALVGSTGKTFQIGVGTYGLMASSSGPSGLPIPPDYECNHQRLWQPRDRMPCLTPAVVRRALAGLIDCFC